LISALGESESGDVLLVESIVRLIRLSPDDGKTSDDFMRSILSAINNMLLGILATSVYKEYRERKQK